MIDHEELKECHKNKVFDAIGEMWDSREENDELTAWDYLYFMNGLYKLQRYEDCLKIYRECKEKFPEENKLDDKMGWSLYQSKLKNHDFRNGDNDTFKRQAEYALRHSTDSKFSPRWRIIELMVKANYDKNYSKNTDYSTIISYLDMVQPESLSSEEASISKNGKIEHFASNREKWFSEKIKALQQLKRYEECIGECDRALNMLDKFHSNNDIWYNYRKIKSLCELGNIEQAAIILTELMSGKFRHWCLYSLLFDIKVGRGEQNEALRNLGECALCDPSHGMRVGFYESAANYLDSIAMNREAELHRQLVLKIRQENNWAEAPRHREWQISENVAAMDLKSVLRELGSFWREQRDQGKEFSSGVVDKLLSSGRDGFIQDEAGNRYYFRVSDITSGKRQLAEGCNVKFTVVERMDKKRNEMKPNAVDIRVSD